MERSSARGRDDMKCSYCDKKATKCVFCDDLYLCKDHLDEHEGIIHTYIDPLP